MREGAGLFPAPKEISFSCSCPDWASMCKHVAAVLYGVGARLDEEPALFFTLRKVEVGELITAAVRATTDQLLTREAAPSARIINDGDLAGLFGISMEEPDFIGTATSPPGFAEQVRSGGEKAAKSVKVVMPGKVALVGKAVGVSAPRGLPKSQSPQPKPRPRNPKRPDVLTPTQMLARLMTIIRRRKYGITADELSALSGCPKTQLYALVQRLKNQGRIKSLGHGVYGKV